MGPAFLYRTAPGRVLLRLLRARWVSRLAGAFLGADIEGWIADYVIASDEGATFNTAKLAENLGMTEEELADSIKTKDGFIDVMITVLSPLNGILEWLLFGDSYTFFSTSDVSLDDAATADVIEGNDFINIPGDFGYEKSIVYILEALGCTMPTVAQLKADAIVNGTGAGAEALGAILDALLTEVDEIGADPINNLLAPVDATLAVLAPFFDKEPGELGVAALIGDKLGDIDIFNLDMAHIIAIIENIDIGENDLHIDITDSDEEIAAVTDIEAPGHQITDLTGVGYFTALTRLNVSDNLLTRLDVSQNTELFDLVCNENRLTELVIKDNEKLADLYCRGNQLTSIEANPKIGNIECGNNPLESLDLTAYHELWGLSCRNCGLTELDLSRNPKMWVLMLDDNQLSSLDLSRCRKLMRLDAMNNQLTEVILGSSYMKEIILTGNPLKELDISMCPLICEVVKTRKYTKDKNFGYGSGWFRMEDGALHFGHVRIAGYDGVDPERIAISHAEDVGV